jgi:ABC-2 type transport system ATP-binding protein
VSSAIETAGLTKYYGKTRGVEGLTLSVPTGATYGFLGPNGAGKTTTIRCLLGMLKPTSGVARLLGQPVALDGASVRKRVGYVAGEVHLYDRETGQWHIDYLSGLREAKPASAADLMRRLEFDPKRRVKQLSKGNKQKLALILALMHDPELLLLDEPTSGLDPLNQQAVFEIIGERVHNGATVFLSSHVLSEVEKICTRVGIIRDGHLVAEEAMADLLAKRLRRLDVTFNEPVPSDLLGGIEGVGNVERFSSTQLRATVLGGAIDEVLQRISRHSVNDIEIERASLEDVFLRFYRGDESAEDSRAMNAPADGDPGEGSSAEGGERS